MRRERESTEGGRLQYLLHSVKAHDVPCIHVDGAHTDLEVPSIHAYGSLWQAVGAGELDVEWPDAAVLGERQGLQGSVEGAPGLGHLPLVDEELAVVQPDSRHLRTRERPAVSWLYI